MKRILIIIIILMFFGCGVDISDSKSITISTKDGKVITYHPKYMLIETTAALHPSRIHLYFDDESKIEIPAKNIIKYEIVINEKND